MQSHKSGPPFHQMTFAGSSKLQSRVTRVDLYSQRLFSEPPNPKRIKALALLSSMLDNVDVFFYACKIYQYMYCEEIENLQFTMDNSADNEKGGRGVEQICYRGGALDSFSFFRDGGVPQKNLAKGIENIRTQIKCKEQ